MVRARETHSIPTVIYPMPIPFGFVREYMALQQKIEKLEKRIAELEAKEKVIVLKEITREEAKEEIRQLFASGRTLYYSDIVIELKIDLETVVDICNELQKDKEISVDGRVSQVR